MEAFYHKEKNQYIFTALRCGTNFLNSKSVRKLGWKKINYFQRLKLDKNTIIFKIIRDPSERFSSWLENFVLSEENHPFHSVKETYNWLVNFEKTISQNPHTEKLRVLYNVLQIKRCKTLYVAMEDLNLLVGTSPVSHVINVREKLNNLPQEIQLILQHFVKKIYHDDYEWIKTLTLLTF